jgi:hypothetical protein
MDVIEAVGLGKRYGRKKWGLRDCTLSVPARSLFWSLPHRTLLIRSLYTVELTMVRRTGHMRLFADSRASLTPGRHISREPNVIMGREQAKANDGSQSHRRCSADWSISGSSAAG